MNRLLRRARYEVVRTMPEAVLIRDLGPHDQFLTVTNAAEEVVEEMYAAETLKPGQRLFYYDSEGDVDEIVHEDGRFVGFYRLGRGRPH
jgi:hypothetical protein